MKYIFEYFFANIKFVETCHKFSSFLYLALMKLEYLKLALSLPSISKLKNQELNPFKFHSKGL